jgi:DNA-binding transcriptional regulator GbsR (MarR family)
MLSALGLEVNKLSRDISVTLSGAQTEIQNLMRNLAGAFGDAVAQKTAAPGKVSQAIGKLVYISVLQEAIDKASRTQHFNVETAINDLWTHLDSARKFASAASNTPSAPSSSGAMMETQRLQQAMQKRAEMFNMLNNIMKQQHEMSKSIIQNMRG